MGYVRTEPDADPLVNVTLWSGDHYMSGVRLPFEAAERLATTWTRGKPSCGRTRFAYVADARLTLKYTPTGLVIALGER